MLRLVHALTHVDGPLGVHGFAGLNMPFSQGVRDTRRVFQTSIFFSCETLLEHADVLYVYAFIRSYIHIHTHTCTYLHIHIHAYTTREAMRTVKGEEEVKAINPFDTRVGP